MNPVCTISSSGLMFWCYGCNALHLVSPQDSEWPGDSKTNENVERPTIYGRSIRLACRGKKYENCHFIIVDGRIYYWGDCTHNLRNHILAMLPIADWFNNEKKEKILSMPDSTLYGWKDTPYFKSNKLAAANPMLYYVLTNLGTFPITAKTKDTWYEKYEKELPHNAKLNDVLTDGGKMSPEQIASLVIRLKERLTA